MKIDKEQWKWTREPREFSVSEDKIEIITNPHTDLWQRTYYHFRNELLYNTTLKKIADYMTTSSMENSLGSMFDFSALLGA